MSRCVSIDRIQAGYVVSPLSLMANAGILVEMDVILGGGFGVIGQEISGPSESDFSGLGPRVGAFDAVWDLVTARLLPWLGVLEGGFGIAGSPPGGIWLPDPLLIYMLMSVGSLIAVCVRPTTKKSIVRRSIRESLA